MKRIICDVITLVFLFFALALLGATLYTNYLWGDVTVSQIFINLEEGLGTLPPVIVMNYVFCILLALFATVVLAFVFSKNIGLFLTACGALLFVLWRIDLFNYIINQRTYTDIYEKEYVYPLGLNYQFPAKKRNLILIYLESVESGYAEAFGGKQNLIKNISEHMKRELSFDGFYQIKNQGFTLAAMVESLCAVPYKSSHIKGYTGYQNFLSSLVCMPEILKNNGYETYFMKGADINFARTKLFLSSHGFSNIWGRDELKKSFAYPFDENEGSFNGYRDGALYEMVKQQLEKIGAENEPFLFSMITLDTHRPNVFLDPSCKGSAGDRKDVMVCADNMLEDFLTWLKAQKFYENTTVVVLGDHPAMKEEDLVDKKQPRQIVNFILNPSPIFKKQPHQAFTTIDVAPTVLNAIGVNFEDGAFGLGRSLFAKAPTLFERDGLSFETELMKASKVYESFETIKTVNMPQYFAYPVLNTPISKGEDLKCYASYSHSAFGVEFLDEVSFSLPADIDGDLVLEVFFRTLITRDLARDIEVLVNQKHLDTWTVTTKDKQPVLKSVKIPASLIENGKLLVKFENQDISASSQLSGLGVVWVNLRLADK
ncbi:MAG: LTA synthase family protein [Alphaproteobacteria bacterium]|nr:LTA synthase family protein [Alphaproteobacteria bacterium]